MDAADVRKVASLARLSLTDDELSEAGRSLSSIIEYVRLLDEVDVEGVEPMSHAVQTENVFRNDVASESLPRAAALQNAPRTDGQFFLVPRILDQKH